MLVLKAVALFASLPFLWAKPTSTSSVLFARTEKDCPAKKFYYAEKSCCLDEGGLPSPPLVFLILSSITEVVDPV